MKKISVIIPVYNTEEYLCDNIESIINQTYKNIEIIYIDDGSTDNSKSIIQAALHKDSRIRLIEENHGGVANARNAGLNIASGDYIAFVDSDDKLETTAFEVAINNICDDELLCYSYKTIGALQDDREEVFKEIQNKHGIAIKNEIIAENMYELFNAGIISSLWNKLFSATVINDPNNAIRFSKDIFCGEDGVFVLEYLNKVKGLRIIANSLYQYRIHANQSINKHYRHYMLNYQQVYDALWKWIETNCGSYQPAIQFSVRWLDFLERGSRETDWSNKREATEYLSSIESMQTKEMTSFLNNNNSCLRIDKRIFLSLVRIDNKKLFKLYGIMLRKIKDNIRRI